MIAGHVERCLLIGSVLVMTGCGGPRVEGIPLAKVGNAVLTREELQEALRSNTGPWTPLDQPGDFVNRWVDRELLYREADLRGLRNEQRIQRELRRLEKDLMIDLVLEREVDRGLRVTEAEVSAYYDAHPEIGQCEETEYLFEHIRVPDTRTAGAIERLLRGASDFQPLLQADLDIEWLQPRSSARFSPASAVPPDIRDQLEKLEPQTVSRRIRKDESYEFLALLGLRVAGSRRSLSDLATDIRGLILAEKRRQRYQRLVAELRNRAEVEINLPADLAGRASDEGRTTHEPPFPDAQADTTR